MMRQRACLFSSTQRISPVCCGWLPGVSTDVGGFPSDPPSTTHEVGPHRTDATRSTSGTPTFLADRAVTAARDGRDIIHRPKWLILSPALLLRPSLILIVSRFQAGYFPCQIDIRRATMTRREQILIPPLAPPSTTSHTPPTHDRRANNSNPGDTIMTRQSDERRFAYIIYTTRIVQSFGDVSHVARVRRMIDRKRNEEISPARFGDISGSGAADASRKMKAIIDQWIQSIGPI
jgi:hypothetical protein